MIRQSYEAIKTFQVVLSRSEAAGGSIWGSNLGADGEDVHFVGVLEHSPLESCFWG